MENSYICMMLIENNEITEEQLNKAYELHKADGSLLNMAVVKLGFVTEGRISDYIKIQEQTFLWSGF